MFGNTLASLNRSILEGPTAQHFSIFQFFYTRSLEQVEHYFAFIYRAVRE